MFIHDTHLPQLLGSRDFLSEEQFAGEIKRLFLPGWHCIAAASELARDGDYKTVDLFGRPLLLWRNGGEIHAFLNVCAHRLATLTERPCGHFGANIKCQYHGWEYDAAGNTCRIPDARNFRPMERGTLGLTKYRAEQCGQLIFVCLAADAPPLSEYLGPLYDVWRKGFSEQYRLAWQYEIRHQANWKLVVENTLESYHTAEVHPKTFGMYPDEEHCTHELHGWWDRYTLDYSYRRNLRERVISRLARIEPTFTYEHMMRYPNLVCSQINLFHTYWTIVPVSPGETRELIWTFSNCGQAGRLRAKVVERILKSWVTRFSERVRDEDAAIIPTIHRGVSALDRPIGGGLISRREERIFAFEKFVLAAMDGSPGARDDLEHSTPARVECSQTGCASEQASSLSTRN